MGAFSKMASRRPVDARSFCMEEKFETWLDVSQARHFIHDCSHHDKWQTSWMEPHNSVADAESICEFHAMGIKPPQIRHAQCTPVLPSVIGLGTIKGQFGKRCHLPKAQFRSLIDKVSSSALISFSAQVAHLGVNISDNLKGFLADDMSTWNNKFLNIPSEVRCAISVNEDLLLIMEMMRKMSEYVNSKSRVQRAHHRVYKHHPRVFLPSLNATAWVTCKCVVLEMSGQTHLLTRELFLEVLNKSSELAAFLLYSWFQTGTSMPDNHYQQACKFVRLIFSTVTSFRSNMCNERGIRLDNRGFTMLKSIEGLGVAYMISRGDRLHGWANDQLMDNLWDALRHEQLTKYPHFHQSPFYELFTTMTIPQLADMLGCVKLAGHPSIEVEDGLEKLYIRTHADINVDYETVRRGIGALTRDLVRNFFLSRKKYPLIVNVHELCLPLRTLINGKIDPSKPRGADLIREITLDQWARVHFGKNAEFDPVDNQLLLIKDKALGLEYNKIWPLLVGDIPIEASLEAHKLENRRALIAFLLSPHYGRDFQKYLQHYINDDTWNKCVLNYLVIKLTPKELELKREGRLFGASPQVERNRRIVQESNTMNLMDDLLPDQLLTPDELTTIRRLISFRYFRTLYPNHHVFQVSFDFSKWNNNMRHDSVDIPASHILDRWFDCPIWGKTMKAFENALIYYQDKTRVRYWEGQLGGIEGLSQATWSFVFIGGVKAALEQLGIVSQLTVKGDDVRAALAIPSHYVEEHGPEGIRDDILGRLSELCRNMGWELNPNETFVSLSVIATSKQYQMNSTWLPASSKKIMKMMSHANLVFPTLEDLVGSIFSCAHSACSQTTVAFPSFASASFIAARELYREWPLRESLINTDYDIASLLLWPQVLGGPGALPLQTFFVRGENDMLSVSVSLLRHLLHSENARLVKRIRNILSVSLHKKPDRSQLITDPYSIALNVPERPMAVLKRQMRKSMKKWVKNKDMMKLLSVRTESDAEKFKKHLLSMKPYCAKVATLLWECSPFYIVEEVLSKFTQSSSVFSFLSQGHRKNHDIRYALRSLNHVLDAAQKRMVFWSTTISKNGAMRQSLLGVDSSSWMDKSLCTTSIVHQVREASWGRKIHGLTYPSLSDQNWLFDPVDTLDELGDRTTLESQTSILLLDRQSAPQTDSPCQHYMAHPNNIPWAGARTSGSVYFEKGLVRVRSSTLTKVMKLIGLRTGGAYLGKGFVETIDALLQSLTTINLRGLATITPEGGGGHIPHRAATNSFSLTTMPNSRPNIAQIVKIDQEGLHILRGDNSDRSINFAARHYYLTALATLPLQSNNCLPPNYPRSLISILHWDMDVPNHYALCPWCCNVIEDQVIIFDEPLFVCLAKYRSIPLVGTSRYEEGVLVSNISKTLEGRARHLAMGHYLDPHDPMVSEAALHIVLRSRFKNSQELFNLCQSHGFQHIPTGNLAEVLAVNLGLRSLHGASLNLLRVIPPKVLYLDLLTETFHAALDLMSNDPHTLATVIVMTLPHRNPLADMFSIMIEAGLMEAISIGACKAYEDDPVHYIRFHWTPGCLQSGHAAAKHFLRAHCAMFVSWIDGDRSFPRMVAYITMEDDDTIATNIESLQKRIVKAIVARCNRSFEKHRALPTMHYYANKAVSKCFPNVKNRAYKVRYNGLPRGANMDDVVNHLTDVITQVLEEPDQKTLDIIHSGRTPPSIEALFHVFTILSLMSSLDMVDVSSDVLHCFGQESSGQTIVEVVRRDIPDWYDHLLDENIIVSTLIQLKCHQDVIQMWVMATNKYLSRKNQVQLQGFQNQIQRNLDVLRIWAKPINEVRFVVMTQEDASRVVKALKLDPSEWAVEDDLNTFQQLILQRTQQPDRPDVCLWSDESHDTYKNMIAVTVQVQTYDKVNPAEWLPGAEASIQGEPESYTTSLDPLDLVRCVGRQNTSICKFIPIFEGSNTLSPVTKAGDAGVIMCLADGIGGVTSYLLRTCSRAKVVYNSLQINTSSLTHPSDCAPDQPPIELLGGRITSSMKERLLWKGMYPGDINDPIVHRTLRIYASEIGSPQLITMDADVQWNRPKREYYELIWNTFTLAHELLTSDGHLVMKSFLLKCSTYTQIVKMIAQLFGHFHLYRSPVTRVHSHEIFMVVGRKHGGLAFTHLKESILEYGGVITCPIPIVSYIRHMSYTISLIRQIHHEVGLSMTRLPMNNIFRTYYSMSALPLELNHFLERLVSHKSCKISHVCKFPDDLDKHVSSYMEELDEVYLSMVPRKTVFGRVDTRRKALYSRSGLELTSGWTSEEHWLRSRITSRCMKWVHMTMMILLDGGQAPTSVTALENVINMDILSVLNESTTSLHVGKHDGQDYLCRPHLIPPDGINLTRLMRENVHLAWRMWGSYLYTCWCIGNQVRFAKEILCAWNPDAEMFDCCVDHCTRLMAVMKDMIVPNLSLDLTQRPITLSSDRLLLYGTYSLCYNDASFVYAADEETLMNFKSILEWAAEAKQAVQNQVDDEDQQSTLDWAWA